MNKSQSIKELAIALSKFQKEAKPITKSATNPFFKSKYAPLESVIEDTKELREKHGLSVSQFPSGENELSTILMHTSGEWIEASVKLHSKDNTPQSQGSAITYMRRYAFSSILGLATEDDDDANVAQGFKETKKQVVTKTPSVINSTDLPF